VSFSDRDRKIVMFVVPVLVLLAFWFLLMSPKREELTKADEDLTKQEQRRDAAQAEVAAAEVSKNTFAADYAQLVKLGKAVPTNVDLPTVIVQLQSAADGTGIEFTRIALGDREAAGAATPPQPPAAPGQESGGQPAPAAAGGAQAGSAPGGAVESAGNAVNDANSTATAREGAAPGGGAPAAAPGAAPPALESMPLDLEFHGSFFKLADFFHSMKRFVRVANRRIQIRGRLLTVESLSFKSDPQDFPKLIATMQATVYLSPKAQGATAGATPQGPATPQGTPTPTQTSPPPSTTPVGPAPTATAAP
jgi:hypothetical protein